MGIGIGWFCPGKWGLSHWDWDLVTGNGENMLKIKYGRGFENCKVGFGKKKSWEMGFVPPLQDPQ